MVRGGGVGGVGGWSGGVVVVVVKHLARDDLQMRRWGQSDCDDLGVNLLGGSFGGHHFGGDLRPPTTIEGVPDLKFVAI